MHHENLKSINMKNKTSAKILPLPAHDDAVEMVKPGNAPVRRMSSLVLDMLIKWSWKEEGGRPLKSPRLFPTSADQTDWSRPG
jgi:hypothetical protein